MMREYPSKCPSTTNMADLNTEHFQYKVHPSTVRSEGGTILYILSNEKKKKKIKICDILW